jgi:hypothetical protein
MDESIRQIVEAMENVQWGNLIEQGIIQPGS